MLGIQIVKPKLPLVLAIDLDGFFIGADDPVLPCAAPCINLFFMPAVILRRTGRQHFYHQIWCAVYAIVLDLIRVANDHEIGDKAVVRVKKQVYAIGKRGAFLATQVIAKQQGKIKNDMIVVHRGPGGHHNHGSPDQLFALFFLIGQFFRHKDTPFLNPQKRQGCCTHATALAGFWLFGRRAVPLHFFCPLHKACGAWRHEISTSNSNFILCPQYNRFILVCKEQLYPPKGDKHIKNVEIEGNAGRRGRRPLQRHAGLLTTRMFTICVVGPAV